MGSIVSAGRTTGELRQQGEKRIGRRVATSGLIMSWTPPLVAKAPWFRRSTVPVLTADVVDLSVSGAKVAVLGAEPVRVGATVRIGLDGASGTASVRRAVHDPGAGSIYGIQFLTLDPALTRRIASLLTGDRAHLEARWALAW